MKTQTEKSELFNAKLQWRNAMRKFFGKDWSKRKASNPRPDGRRHMNVGIIK